MPTLRAALAATFALTALSPADPAVPLATRAPPAAPGAAVAPLDESEETPPVRRATSWRSSVDGPLSRIAEAEARRDVVKGLFTSAGVSFPPAQMLLRGFKKEHRLELWAASRAGGPFAHVTTYEICSGSGDLGPKRRQGDRQVPEGFYTLTEYNPASRYHLAMLVSYPSLSDRILGDKVDPGNEIMIHGRCASVGCLAMTDERIQEIWIAATALRYAGGVVHVHIFPSRDMKGLLAANEHPEHRAFWENLQEGKDFFESRKRLPTVRVEPDGRYRFR
ncbi:MAG: L,D-transpeptidase family protein [Minicystis sp.]